MWHCRRLTEQARGSLPAAWRCLPLSRAHATQSWRLADPSLHSHDGQASSDMPTAEGGAPAYQTHIPLNVFQRGSVAVLSAVGAVTECVASQPYRFRSCDLTTSLKRACTCASPARADLVAALGETTGQWAFERMRARMTADVTGRRILAERPRITVCTPGSKLLTGRICVVRVWDSCSGISLTVLRRCADVQNTSVEHTWALPAHTFGGAYARFMGDRNFQADDRCLDVHSRASRR